MEILKTVGQPTFPVRRELLSWRKEGRAGPSVFPNPTGEVLAMLTTTFNSYDHTKLRLPQVPVYDRRLRIETAANDGKPNAWQ